MYVILGHQHTLEFQIKVWFLNSKVFLHSFLFTVTYFLIIVNWRKIPQKSVIFYWFTPLFLNDSFDVGLSINDVWFLGLFFDLPSTTVLCCPNFAANFCNHLPTGPYFYYYSIFLAFFNPSTHLQAFWWTHSLFFYKYGPTQKSDVFYGWALMLSVFFGILYISIKDLLSIYVFVEGHL